MLQLTTLLRINPLHIRSDEGHHLGISDHGVGVARGGHRGKDGPACKAEVAGDETTAIYFGMVNPLAATITCHTS